MKTVLITGGSKGIGFELAKQFASDHYDILLTARNLKELDNAATVLKNTYSVNVSTIAIDLSDPNATQQLYDKIMRFHGCPDVLVNNAGFGLHGNFATLDYRLQTDMLQVNIVALTGLTRLFLPSMITRKHGIILNVASTASFFSGPYMSVYYATKTYVRYFSDALSHELEGTGVQITTLCPGPTKTDFETRSGFDKTNLVKRKLMPMMSATDVAIIGYKGMKRKKLIIIPGFANKIGAFLSFFIPMHVTGKVLKKLNSEK
jgi:short-subunit dehydrogenase